MVIVPQFTYNEVMSVMCLLRESTQPASGIMTCKESDRDI